MRCAQIYPLWRLNADLAKMAEIRKEGLMIPRPDFIYDPEQHMSDPTAARRIFAQPSLGSGYKSSVDTQLSRDLTVVGPQIRIEALRAAAVIAGEDKTGERTLFIANQFAEWLEGNKPKE